MHRPGDLLSLKYGAGVGREMGEKTSEMMLCCLTPMVQQHPPYSEGTMFAHFGSSCLMDKSKIQLLSVKLAFSLSWSLFFPFLSNPCTT